ncbi:MAG: aldo/keto reductase [Synergistaceae bacterium]|nr:aldo/keto reductase [Synergistaceae bacterium]
MGKTGLRVSRFGLGCMRFPPDEKEAVSMVRHAIDNGVNYIDTAYTYPGSEDIVGKALRDGYREKVCLVTKCPVALSSKKGDLERFLDEQLKRLQTDYTDIYLLHNLSPAVWEKAKKYDGPGFLDNVLKKGKILHKGFSLHNTFEAFKEIIDCYKWDMTQIQLNILDEKNQAGGVEGLKYASSKGLPVTIMEPLRGGSLVKSAPESVLKMVESYTEKRSLAEWCFRWLYDQPEVSVVLSGTSTMEQLDDNLRIFKDSSSGVMSKDDKDLIDKLRKEYGRSTAVPCTDCKYCMPCTQGVMIAPIFSLYNEYRNTMDVKIKDNYKEAFFKRGRGADMCVSCGVCERHCPQGLEIIKLLAKVHEDLLI